MIHETVLRPGAEQETRGEDHGAHSHQYAVQDEMRREPAACPDQKKSLHLSTLTMPDGKLEQYLIQ